MNLQSIIVENDECFKQLLKKIEITLKNILI